MWQACRMTAKEISAFGKIAMQCSHYEHGERYCDLCGVSVFIHEPIATVHKEDCPITIIKNLLALAVRQESHDKDQRPLRLPPVDHIIYYITERAKVEGFGSCTLASYVSSVRSAYDILKTVNDFGRKND